jgi:hypothetical protein
MALEDKDSPSHTSSSTSGVTGENNMSSLSVSLDESSDLSCSCGDCLSTGDDHALSSLHSPTRQHTSPVVLSTSIARSRGLESCECQHRQYVCCVCARVYLYNCGLVSVMVVREIAHSRNQKKKINLTKRKSTNSASRSLAGSRSSMKSRIRRRFLSGTVYVCMYV